MTPEEMIRSVICILAADGTINAQEKQFLQQLCQRFHISEDVCQSSLPGSKHGKGHIAIPDTAKEQKQFFSLLVQAAMADGTVGMPERKMLNAVAAKLGISAAALEQYLATKKTAISSAPISREASPVKKSDPSSRRKHISDTSYQDSISAQ